MRPREQLDGNINDTPSIEVTNSRNALDLALAGASRAVLPTFVGNSQKGLQQVTPLIEALDHEQWLVTRDQDRFRPEVRRTIERVYAVLSSLRAREITLDVGFEDPSHFTRAFNAFTEKRRRR